MRFITESTMSTLSAERRRNPVRGDFDAVYEAQRQAITRVAYLVVRDAFVAEELAQEAFLRLYARFDAVHNPAGFLRTTVVHLGINWSNRHRMEAKRIELVAARVPGGFATDTPTIDETWAALGRLTPERAAVLVLRFYEDLSFDDIANILGASAATIRSRTRRALNDLRKELDQ